LQEAKRQQELQHEKRKEAQELKEKLEVCHNPHLFQENDH